MDSTIVALSPSITIHIVKYFLVSTSTLAATSSPTTTNTTTTTIFLTIATIELPFYRESPFIIGMVILAILLLFICLAVLLCCVRPRRSKTPLEKSQLSNTMHMDDLTPMPSKKPSPERPPVVGSWSPHEDYTVSAQTIMITLSCELYFTIAERGNP